MAVLSPSTRLRRAAAVGAVLGVLVLTSPVGPLGAQDPATDPFSTDPLTTETIDTSPAPTDPVTGETIDPGGADTTVPAEEDVEADEGTRVEVLTEEDLAAQARAEDDLEAVWRIVAALSAVAVALFVLLVLYVRATNPRRAAARRAAREDAARAKAARRAERRARKGKGEGPDEEPALLPVLASEIEADGTEAEAESDETETETEPEPEPDRDVVPVSRVRPAPAPPAQADDSVDPAAPTEGVRVLTDAEVAEAAARATPRRPPPSTPRPAPPRTRRPPRVAQPAKELGTPDAERVLVRPGQAPVRVPLPAEPTVRVDGSPPAPPEGPDGR